MTDQQHPITPPPEMVQQLRNAALFGSNGELDYELRLIHAAYRAGADQELEACCEWVEREIRHGKEWGAELRAARRPKPPSLKEQALETLRQMHIDPETGVSPTALDTIRRALEQLDDH